MKVIKKISAFVLMLTLCVGMITMTVSAETTLQDGLEITLTSDKQVYDEGEPIKAILSVVNTNDFAVENISLENEVPEGYKLSDDSLAKEQIEFLEAGERIELTVTYIKDTSVTDGENEPTEDSEQISSEESKEDSNNISKDNNSKSNDTPETGDQNNVILWGGLAFFALIIIMIVLAIIKRKHSKHLLSLLLCFVMLGSIFSNSLIPAKAAGKAENKTVQIEHTIKVEGTSVNLKATVNYQMPSPDDSSDFNLRANKNSVFIDEEGTEVYFYLETSISATSVTLMYGEAENINMSIDMYDDGTGADDIAGDGVYSAVVAYDAVEDTEVSYFAQYGDIQSNTVTVNYYTAISDTTLEIMDQVNEAIKTLLDSFKADPNLTYEEKAAKTLELLTGFESEGLIEQGSIQHYEDSKLVSFLYPEGILGGVMYGGYHEDMNTFSDEISDDNNTTDVQVDQEGSDDNNIRETEEISNEGVQEDADLVQQGLDENEEVTSDDYIDTRSELEDSYEVYNIPSLNGVSLFSNQFETNDVSDTVGKAIILNSFPDFESDAKKIQYRTDFYNELKNEWDESGLDTTLIMSTPPTVEDYKNLEGYDVICFSTHGSTYKWNDGFLWLTHHEYPAICLSEDQTPDKNKEYEKELKDKQIVAANGAYWLLPAFFTEQYDEGDFANTFVFSECCMAMGEGKGDASSEYDYSMANAILGRDANSYIGFHNSVFADYSREFMQIYVNELVKGDSSLAAYNQAIDALGANHEEWYNATHSQTLKEYYESDSFWAFTSYNPKKVIAYPVHNGNENAVLAHSGLQNGGFESYYSSTTSPRNWVSVGDVRTLTVLGPITPQEKNRMAIVTTGIGSQNSASFGEGTEGSSLSQTFVVPDTAKTLQFNYNFVSEEPMEYVGSSFNDSFVVQVSQGENTFHDKTYESINTSEWKEVSDIDFVGGDHTTYETGWKTAEIDLSQYAGQTVTLNFIIYDVGDEIYDSACVIDNVVVQ